MRLLVSALLACAALASTPEQNVPDAPSAWTSVASRTTNLLTMLWFPQKTCAAETTFYNVAPAANSTDLDFLPVYTRMQCIDDPSGLEVVQNGIGIISGQADEAMMISKGTIEAELHDSMQATCAFTFEFWLKFTGNVDVTGGGERIYPIMEMGFPGTGSWTFSASTMSIVFMSHDQDKGGDPDQVILRVQHSGKRPTPAPTTPAQRAYAVNTVELQALRVDDKKTYHLVVTRGNSEGTISMYLNEYTGFGPPGTLTPHVMSDVYQFGEIDTSSPSLSPTCDGVNSKASNRLRFLSSSQSTYQDPVFDLLYYAHYDVKFDATRVTNHLTGGPPNSKPQSFNLMTINVREDKDTAMDLLLQDSVVKDIDGDPLGFFIVTKPTQGTLKINGVGAAAEDQDFFTFSELSTLMYKQTTVHAKTDTCTPGGGYDSMVVRAWDGVCGTEDFSNTDCHSQDITVTICVDAKNDPPFSQDASPIDVREGTYLGNEIELFANDIDDKTDPNVEFSLEGFRIVSQSRPDLGNITLFSGGACTDVAVELPFLLNSTSIPVGGTSPVSIDKICYKAKVSSGSTTTLVGTDVITFRARDFNEYESPDYTVSVNVYNALIAGCYAAEPFPTNPQLACPFEVAEDLIGEPTADATPGYLLKLEGRDSLEQTGARNESGRVFIVRSLPNEGDLFPVDSFTALTTGDLPYEIAAQQWNQPDIGKGYVRFKPNKDYFTSACLGRDYYAFDVATHACRTLGAAGGSTSNLPQGCDVFGNSFNSCNDAGTCVSSPSTFKGCPVTFEYSIGFKEDGVTASSAGFDGVAITIYNINDDPVMQASFSEILEIEKNAQPRDKFTDKSRTIAVVKTEESDTRMVRFSIKVRDSKAKISNRDIDTAVISRFKPNNFEGSTCLETGCTIITLYGYPSDINTLLEDLEFTTTQDSGEDEVKFVISASPWEAGANSFPVWDIASEVGQTNVTIRLQFGEEGGAPSAKTNWYVYAAIFGGAAALGLMCLASLGTMLVRARQGEKVALWVFNNILCTKVQHKDPAKREMALADAVKGADRALEHAIDSEHRHMVEVLWCVHCLACFLPCCVKYDRNAKVPSKEDMMEKALAVESDRIAAKHKPEGKPGAKDATKEDLEVDTIADDSIFDWERHVDKKTGRHYYYNPVTHESRWSPPEVVVHSKTKKKVVSMRKSKRFAPKPPSQPKEDGSDGSDVV